MDFNTKVELRSEIGIDYTKLQQLLATGQWQEADLETLRVMRLSIPTETDYGFTPEFHEILAWFQIKDIENFPCKDLLTIDQLWMKYSKGKFSFSVQKKIYIDELGGTIQYKKEICEKLGDRVGWRNNGNWLKYNQLSFERLDTTPIGHLPGLVFMDISQEGWVNPISYTGCFCGFLFSRLVNCNT